MSTLIGFCAGFAFGGGFGALVAAVLVKEKQERKPLFTESQRNEILKTANDALVKGIKRRNDLLAEMYQFFDESCPPSCPFIADCRNGTYESCKAADHYREELRKLCVEVGAEDEG